MALYRILPCINFSCMSSEKWCRYSVKHLIWRPPLAKVTYSGGYNLQWKDMCSHYCTKILQSFSMVVPNNRDLCSVKWQEISLNFVITTAWLGKMKNETQMCLKNRLKHFWRMTNFYCLIAYLTALRQAKGKIATISGLRLSKIPSLLRLWQTEWDSVRVLWFYILPLTFYQVYFVSVHHI